MKKRIIAWMLMGTVMMTSLVGCSSNNEAKASSDKVTTSEQVNKDPMGKYDEPVKVTAILSYGAAGTNVPPETTPETQGFVKIAKELLNIELEFLWTAPPDQYEQKLGVAMASGDLPDVMSLNANDYEMLRDNDQIMPLNDVLDYASDTFKEWIYKDPNIIENVTHDGQIMAIPQYWDGKRGLNVMMIREDWLKDVGMEVPKTIDEFTAVMRAFKEQKGAEVGISLTKALTGYRSVNDIINMFGGYLNAWVDNGEGELIPGEIQPETKEALRYMNQLYSEGLIHKEFAMHDGTKASELTMSNKAGIVIGPWWMFDGLGKVMYKNPEARWAVAPVPSSGEGKAMLNRVTMESYKVINKDCKNPEAVIKLYNLWVDFETAANKYGEMATEKGGHVWNWVPTNYYNPFDIQTEHDNWNKYIEEANGVFTAETFPDELQDSWLDFWEMIPKYYEWKAGNGPWDEKNRMGRMLSRIDKDFGWGETMRIVEDGNFVYNEYYRNPTPTMVERSSTLTKLTEETFLKIIMGELPVDAFDKYTQDWLKLGGQQIIEEINEWYETVKE